MPHTLILILVGSGCLLLRESGAEIYGTYSVFDHLGSYSEPNRPKNVTIIQKKASPFTKTLQISSSPSPSIHQQSHGQNYVYGQQQQQNRQTNPQPQQQIYPAASPLAIPQYEDSIARPFSEAPDSASTGAASTTSSTTTASPISTTHQTSLQVTSGNPPPAQSQARVPLYVYNPGLARRLGLGTFMMGSVLYGLTLLPALLAVGATTGVGPFAGLMSSLSGSESRRRRRRRRKRSNPPPLVSSNAYKFREMPLLDNSSSYKFLSLVENTMEIRKIGESSCKKFYVCKIYQSALESSERPSPQDFEIAVIDTFGIAAERTGYKFDLIAAVRYYLDAALVGLMRGNCSKIFPCAEPLFRFFPLWSDQRNKN